ncbi:MAG: secondary thiamine-phosphate synthase enzyme [Polaribacter sp.]|jgi:secondary thiamine-phosphate synthase enzyme
MWFQKEINLRSQTRGFQSITQEILTYLPEIGEIKCGLLHLFIQHTSASLAINEDADPTVRLDLETHFTQSVPEGMPYYLHDDEGDDDMPAHIKATIIGPSLSIPITHGQLNLGTWQGIYLCEHRNQGGSRCLIATLQS